MVRKVFSFFLIALMLTGCAAPKLTPTPPSRVEVKIAPYSPPSIPTPSPEREVRPLPTPEMEVKPLPTIPREEALSRAIKRAIADLSRRLGIPESEIEVVSASWREMPIQEVECHQPEGKITLPAFVMGVEVVLMAQGKTYVYRGRGEMVTLCIPGEEKPTAYNPILERVLALFESKGISREEIKVIMVECVTWPDTSLGCPEPGKFYAQVLVPGYRIVLEVKGLRVEVHTDLKGRVVICSPIKL
ncbi:MAG: hypothetical protein RMK30_00375 [Anaerolineae bacterium]|nr:hypothetical protein [Anaerolineae bacterium]